MYQPSAEFQQAAFDVPKQNPIIAAKRLGWQFLKSLEAQLQSNPNLFESYSTRDIAVILKNCNECNLDKSPDLKQNVLVPLYAAYDIKRNHAFRAWDMDKRAELMRSIQEIPDLEHRLEHDRFATLIELHHLHAKIYGFKPDTVTKKIQPALTPRIERENGESINDYIISHASRSRKDETIYINTFFPDKVGIPSKFYWADGSQIAGLIFHEGRHTHQTQMIEDSELMQYGEFNDIATIMNLSTYGDYYLKDSDKIYMQNPSEKDAYDFQKDMQDFIKASPEMRKTLIFQMEQRRDAHLTLSAQSKSVTTPLPELIAA